MGTIPEIPAAAAGQVVTADTLNDIAETCTFLLTKPMARIHDITGGHSLTTSFSVVSFTTKDFDTDSIWTATHTNRLNVNTPGWYKCRYSVQIAGSSSAAQNYETMVQGTTGSNNPLGSGINLARALPGYGYQISTGKTTFCGASGIIPYYLYVGDFLQVNIKATTAAGATGIDTNMPQSFFSIEFVSA